MPDKPTPNMVRKNILMPPDWWDTFAKRADAEGLTLSAWLGECAAANIPKRDQRKLSERRKRGGSLPK